MRYSEMSERAKVGARRRTAKYAKSGKGRKAAALRQAHYREHHPDRIEAAKNTDSARHKRRTLDSLRKGHIPCLQLPPPKPHDGKCQCCGRSDLKLVPDHDHRTGLFRGWLCDRCNLGIGGLGDDLESLERAVAYLKRAKAMNESTTKRTITHG